MYVRELKRIYSSAVAVALAATLATGCARAQSAPATGRGPAAKAIQIEPVRQESVRRTLEVVGTLAAEDEVTISSQADGIVSRVLADLGDHVRAGQVPAR